MSGLSTFQVEVATTFFWVEELRGDQRYPTPSLVEFADNPRPRHRQSRPWVPPTASWVATSADARDAER